MNDSVDKVEAWFAVSPQSNVRRLLTNLLGGTCDICKESCVIVKSSEHREYVRRYIRAGGHNKW
jgi:hypothetical protein